MSGQLAVDVDGDETGLFAWKKDDLNDIENVKFRGCNTLLPLFRNKRASVLCPRVIPMILLGFHP